MKIVFDLDGVITDIWRPVESVINSDPELFALLPSWGIQDEAGFSFDKHVSDYAMTCLSKPLRSAVLGAFADPRVLENPLPMPDYIKTLAGSWVVHSVADVPSFRDYAEFLNHFTFMGDDVECHTVVANKACADARMRWFAREIKPYAPDVDLRIDIKNKKPLVGDIIVEDCLENLVSSQSSIRVLRKVFHNSLSSQHNIPTYADLRYDRSLFQAPTFIALRSAVKVARQILGGTYDG